MRLVSFDGVTFTTLGLTSPGFDNPSSPGPQRSQAEYPRIGANPAVGAVETGTQVLTATFTPATGQSTETTLLKLFAVLNPDNPEPRTLVAELEDGTDIETQAQPGNWRYTSVNTAAVDFTITTPGWYAQADTTLKANATHTANGSFTNLNTGYRDILPVILIDQPASVTERTSSTADFGFKRRQTVTITNTSTQPLINYPYQLGPFNSAANVSGGATMQADGDDIRVFCQGVEWPRTLIGMNTLFTFVWVVIPWLAPEQSLAVDLVWFNSSAANPPTLSFTSTPMRPALDISGYGIDTNTSATATTVTISGAGWETDQWQGGTVITGTNFASPQMRRVASNTATALTITRAWGTTPGTTSDVTVIKSGLMGDGGTASAGASTSITDSSQVWRTNEWIGATAKIISGTGTGSIGTVTSNTATALTVSSWSGTSPAASSVYIVYRTNGAWLWDVREPPKTTNHPGLWLTNKTQAPPTQVEFGNDAPGGWHRFTYLRNKDAYSQPRYDTFSVGAGDNDHIPVMRLRRARSGKMGGQTEVGVADSIGVSSPFPILGAYFGYTIRNAKKPGVSEGMAEFRAMVLESGNSNWSTFLSDIAVNNSTSAVASTWYDLTTYGSPNRLGMTLIPNGEDEIPKSEGNTAEVRSDGNYVALSVNGSALTSSYDWIANSTLTGTIAQDISLIIRTGGASATVPYHRLVIGGTDHRIFLAALDEVIRIDCEAQEATLVTAAGVYVRNIAYAVQAQQVVDDPLDGSDEELIAARWLPIPPTTRDSANIYFTDPSGAGWGNLDIAVTGRKGYWT
jgi:hypothetical protein